jgi:hypothetical protein
MALYCVRVGDPNPHAVPWIGSIFTKKFVGDLLRVRGAKLRSLMTRSRQLPMILILEAEDNRAVGRIYWALGQLGNVRIEVERL